MTARCKLQLSSIKSFMYSSKELQFQAIYDSTTPEDVRFAKATPSGNVTLMVDNPAVLEQMVIGKYYYVDISPVPEA